MNQPTFTQKELDVIFEGLNQMILDGFPESDDDPIITAYIKIKGKHPYDEDEQKSRI